jgi:hypothetical protein
MNLLGKLRVQLSAETSDYTRGLNDARKKLTTFSQSIKKFERSTVAQFITLGALSAEIRAAVDTANEYDNAQRQLAATAKLTGTALSFLQSTSKSAQDQFQLSQISANSFTIELSKLASKAGDLGKTSAGLEAFLDIGAARGLTASETLAKVKQSILGIDEGTDALFNKNPSVLYAEWAKQIGTTAGKLTDQQKAQALLNAAMTDGAKVRGEYQKWLQTSQGQQYLLTQGIEKTQAAIGKALQPAVVAILPLLSVLAKTVEQSAKGWQIFSQDLKLWVQWSKAAGQAMIGNFSAALDIIHRANAEYDAAVKNIKNGSLPALDTSLPTTNNPSGGDATDAGKKTALEYWDGLATEWEDLRNEVALKSISLTGTDDDRLSLEEDHQLQLLAIEQQKLEAQRQAGEITEQEYQAGLRELATRKEITKARRTELQAVGESLTKQQHILDLTNSLSQFLPGAEGGPLSDIGTKLGTLASDMLNVAGILGNMILPAVGGILGSLLGGLFSKGKDAAPPIVHSLNAIERAQKETITVIEQQTDALLHPENRWLNLPANFSVPSYNPVYGAGGGGWTVTRYGDVNVEMSFNVTGSVSPEEIRDYALQGITGALRKAIPLNSRTPTLSRRKFY